MHNPIKRHQALKPVSREHHHGLLLSWKIRNGIKNKIELPRIKKYLDWYWINHLQQHFVFEEQYLFPILGSDHALVSEAIIQHREIEQLFFEKDNLENSLQVLEKKLENHIRFEERILFKVIEQNASEEQLQIIENAHQQPLPQDNYSDPFW